MGTPALAVFGRSLQIDPTFPYYLNRSVESVASEIRSTGYRIVRYILTAESNLNPALLAEFHRQGIGVWYVTFCNGTYTAKDLPAGWERWRMVTRTVLEGKAPDPSFLHLCLNNPEYRAWKKQVVTRLLRDHPFQGVDLVEPHWPEYPGPTSPAYGCFCTSCQAAFKRLYPEEEGLPDLLHPDGPRGEQGNPALWAKWIEFRTRTLTEFLDDLVNGQGSIRRGAPRAKVCVWTLPLTEPDGVERMRRDSGEDAARVARVVRPDLYCFQTHWPDWTRPDLAPDYVEKFKPFFEQVRSVAPRMPLMVQADTGSGKDNRRSWKWIHQFEAACARLGVGSTTCYEYFIGDYIYTDPPRIFEAKPGGDGTVALHFTKRLDPATAGDVARYRTNYGRVVAAKVDGSIVRLSLAGVARGATVTITAARIGDDTSVRLYKDRPQTWLDSQSVTVRA
jgi:hypothetical protein